MPFNAPPRIQRTQAQRDGRPIYILLLSLIYTGARDVFYVPRGFLSDLASVPRLFWYWFPPDDPQYAAPAILHDKFYETHEVSRKDADGIFYRQMRELKVSWIRRKLIYWAVRAAGSKAYHAHD